MFDDFETIIQTMGDLPPVPTVATKVFQMLQDPRTSLKDLAKVISHDPALSARLLKIANSAFYSVPNEVSTLERAVVLMGETTVRNLVFESYLRAANASFGVMQRRIWEDSMGCAIGTRLIIQHLGGADPDEAFLAGLFRHVGKIVMHNRHPETYRQALQLCEHRNLKLLDVERGLFAYSHEKVGAAILDHWHFPPLLVQSTLHHHDLSVDTAAHPDLLLITAAVNLAGALCLRLGIGRSAPLEDWDWSLGAGIRILAVSPGWCEELLAEFEVAFKEERKFFLAQ
jgi:HD-like signal output (HDOD) protein